MRIKERTKFCVKCWCGRSRPLKMIRFWAIDPLNPEERHLVMIASRDCACFCCCSVIDNEFKLFRITDDSKQDLFARITQRYSTIIFLIAQLNLKRVFT